MNSGPRHVQRMDDSWRLRAIRPSQSISQLLHRPCLIRRESLPSEESADGTFCAIVGVLTCAGELERSNARDLETVLESTAPKSDSGSGRVLREFWLNTISLGRLIDIKGADIAAASNGDWWRRENALSIRRKDEVRRDCVGTWKIDVARVANAFPSRRSCSRGGER